MKQFFFLVPDHKVKNLKNTMIEILADGTKVKTPIKILGTITSPDNKYHIYRITKA